MTRRDVGWVLLRVRLWERHGVHETSGRMTIVGISAVGVPGVDRGRSRRVIPAIIVGLHPWVKSRASTVGTSSSSASICRIRHPT